MKEEDEVLEAELCEAGYSGPSGPDLIEGTQLAAIKGTADQRLLRTFGPGPY